MMEGRMRKEGRGRDIMSGEERVKREGRGKEMVRRYGWGRDGMGKRKGEEEVRE